MSSSGQASFAGMLMSPIASKTVWHICVYHIQLWYIAVCKLPSQTKVAIMPTHIWLVIIENSVRFSGLGFRRTIIRELQECHRVPSKKSYVVFVRASVLPKGYLGIYWIWSHQNKTMPILHTIGWRSFLSAVRIRVELIRRTRRRFFVHTAQGSLIVAGFRLWHPDRWPRQPSDHRWYRMLADRTQKWTWSNAIFDDECWVSL